jgi:hypothetical protein
MRHKALMSVALLIPCFWQRRIQAVDLCSHIYNSWLAQQIESGKAPGLTIVPISTNVLFDILLTSLFKMFGAEPAQRIAVAISVLIFFWGAFVLVSRINGGHRWYLAPCLMMLTYGWVFHMGFSNFYLASGLSLWALVFAMRPGIVSRAIAGVLLLVAYTAYAIPPVWAICILIYSRVADRLSWRARQALFLISAAGILALKWWITSRYQTTSTFHQVLESVAIDQVWVFGYKYIAISIGLAMLWSFLLLRMLDAKGVSGILGSKYFHLCVLMAIGILLIPSTIELPQYRLPLSFLTERMTLLYGVLICAFLAGADPPRWMRIAFTPLALLYFSFIYADTNALNEVERQMEYLTRNLTLQDRVFSSFEDPTSRTQLWGHNLDRVCLGRCISYANYEPSTLQFRIRATGPNPLVVADIGEFGAMQQGGYRVKASDLPLYQITLCDSSLCLRKLEAGEVTKHDLLVALPLLW